MSLLGDILVGSISAALGVLLGAVAAKRRAKLVGFVSACDLSGNLLSGVDYVECDLQMVSLIDALAEKVDVPAPFKKLKGATKLTTGAAMAHAHTLQAFELSVDAVRSLVDRFLSAGGASTKLEVAKGLADNNLYLGVLRSLALSGRLADHISDDVLAGFPANCVMPTEEVVQEPDIMTGEPARGRFIVRAGPLIIQMHYDSRSTRSSIRRAVFALAEVGDRSIAVATLIKQQLTEDLVAVRTVRDWVAKEVPRQSRIVVDVAITNSGTAPALLGRVARIELSGGTQKRCIELFAESYENDRTAGTATARLARLLESVSSSLHVPMPISNWVPREEVLVAPDSSRTIQFRSSRSLQSIASAWEQDVDQVVKQFEAAADSATVVLTTRSPSGRVGRIRSVEFKFGPTRSTPT